MKYQNKLSGWLCFDKPAGISSNFAMQKIRRIFSENTGYIGTLDPFATGVLPIAIGEARKFIQYSNEKEKKYICVIKFGYETDTLDSTGRIINTNDYLPSYKDIKNILSHFVGDIVQTPPAYSAIKISGIRACDKVRMGHTFEIPQRTVKINNIKIINENLINKEITLEVSCSKGTYIRTLAIDIATKLGTLAHVKELKRIKSGFFNIKQAISLEKILKIKDTTELVGFLYPLESPLDDIPALYLTEEDALKLHHGLRVKVNRTMPTLSLVKLFNEDTFIGVGRFDDDGCVKPIRMCIDKQVKELKDVDNK